MGVGVKGFEVKHGAASKFADPELRAIYNIWCSMKERCTVPSQKRFGRYGGRGIAVCDRWMKSFENFLADMGRRTSPQHSIDRWPDMNGNYEPTNCRWATVEMQARNRSNNHVIEFRGESRCITEWAEILGIKMGTISQRINKYGWSVERALTTPPGPQGKRY